MSLVRNLIPGQYQIGDIVFGKGTTVRVETFDIKPYDVNTQDYQVSRSDQKRFGWDQLAPTTIELTFHVMKNWLLPQYEDDIPNFWDNMPTVEDFQREWRADDIRNVWGEMKSLYVCNRAGITKAVYGRPDQFTYAQETEYTELVQCVATFRRADTFSYGKDEYGVNLYSGHLTDTISGTDGDAPSWMRVLILGPIVSPSITFTNMMLGTITIELDYTVSAGEVVEVSSYPWSQRAVSSTGENLSTKLIGATPFLDRIRFASTANVQLTLSGTGMNGNTNVLVLYRNAYQVI